MLLDPGFIRWGSQLRENFHFLSIFDVFCSYLYIQLCKSFWNFIYIKSPKSKLYIIWVQKFYCNSTENMEFFTFTNKSRRNPRKLAIRHKEDHSTLVRLRKVLCKARYLNLILPIKTYLHLKGSDISEGNIFGWLCYMCLFLFIDFTDVFIYSLDSCFFCRYV